jgi:hypothetical protein
MAEGHTERLVCADGQLVQVARAHEPGFRALSRPANSTCVDDRLTKQWLVLYDGRSPASRGYHVTCRNMASGATQDQWSTPTTACIMHNQQQQSPVAHVAAKHTTTQDLISDMLQNSLTCPPTFPCATLQHRHQRPACTPCEPNKQGRCTLGNAKWRCRGFWICQKHNACRRGEQAQRTKHEQQQQAMLLTSPAHPPAPVYTTTQASNNS